MSRHLERLLQLDSLIRSEQRQTIGNLALSLEVSERTIRNDLAFLRDRFHAPLKFSRVKGFHYTDDTWRLPSVSLSKGELFALIVGARILESYPGFVHAQELRSAIARLSERLPEQAWLDLQTIADERIIFRSGAEINLNPDIWHSLEEACQTHRQVQMTYFTASRNSLSERKLDPYLLHIYRGTNPYVIGYCHNRQEVRWFRVDRIQALELLETSFIPDPTFDAKDHLEMIFQHEAGGLPQPIAIWFDPATAPYIRERRWHPTQEIEEHPDGSLTLNMVVRGLNDLKRWVLFYGKGAIVKRPPELVQMIQSEVAIMNTLYKGETNACH
ncbi:YafY family protein [Synechococcus sp. PCC 6312]|uniref:helix-turn-helix transcriptional regulator n=1 Tax=Synechococcus sp. (strain ATCC 27167 / PCC 6312) TaxID=195253 RepID=UPI00029F4481|nr:WYL domain-containing transcriptional regulator [Synechococcus sp. PCC 6312]AFY60385.1 putative transcriptional regulator [Synechococcus sp. PCC 6312]